MIRRTHYEMDLSLRLGQESLHGCFRSVKMLRNVVVGKSGLAPDICRTFTTREALKGAPCSLGSLSIRR